MKVLGAIWNVLLVMGGYFSHKKEDSESKASGKKTNQEKKVVSARAPLLNCPKYVLKRTG